MNKWAIPTCLKPASIKAAFSVYRKGDAKQRLIRYINRDSKAALVLVPHYYLFEEATKSLPKLALYLPDYMPHLFKGIAFEKGRDKANAAIGRRLCRHAHTILTASEFSASYLPECDLQAEKAKITVFPLPILASESRELSVEEEEHLAAQLGHTKYIFYPTANRPNKQLAFLLDVMGDLLNHDPDLVLVLTCNLSDYRPAHDALNEVNARLRLRGEGSSQTSRDAGIAQPSEGLDKQSRRREGAATDLTSRLVFKSGVSDGALQWLYQHAAALCFTSTMEGNFPPQVFEALMFATPVVATKLPLITEILGEDCEDLILCSPLDKSAFVAGVLKALNNPDEVRARQQTALRKLLDHSSDERFARIFGFVLRDRLGL